MSLGAPAGNGHSRLHSPALPCANSTARGSRGPTAAPSLAKGPAASHRHFGFIFVRAGPEARAGCGPLRVPSPQACLRAWVCHRSKSTRAAPGVCAAFPRSPCSCCRAISCKARLEPQGSRGSAGTSSGALQASRVPPELLCLPRVRWACRERNKYFGVELARNRLFHLFKNEKIKKNKKGEKIILN